MKRRLAVAILITCIGLAGCNKPNEITTTSTEATEIAEEEVETTEYIGVSKTEIIAETEVEIVEIEGGDGEEVTEEVVESTETEVEETKPVENTNLFNIVDCDPVTKYTNTNANIRAIPDKSGELVDTVTTNTELTINGTTEDGSWSRTERNGVVCYIKSSLLSDTKTEVKQPSNSGSASNTGSNNQSQTQSGGTSQPSQSDTSPDTQPSQPSQSEQKALEDALSSLGWTESGDVVMGSGDTGNDGSGGGMNVQ